MEKENVFQFDNSGWPEKGDALPEVFIKFPFQFDFTEQDLEMLRTGHASTSLGFKWLFISDDKIFIHRGGRCFFQLSIYPGKLVHTAIHYIYTDIDKFVEGHHLKPMETLMMILRKWTDNPRSVMLRTVRSVVYGHAVADALGVPVEFRSRQELKANPVQDMIGYGTHHMPAGTWSDDTSMALATLDSLSKGVNYNDIMLRFESWKVNAAYTATNEVFDMGISTNMAISRFQNGTPTLKCGCNGEQDNGNGSLMRIYPAALYWYYPKSNDYLRNVLDKFVFELSGLTHAHLRSQLGCGIYTYVLLHLLSKRTKRSVLDGLYDAQMHFSKIAAYSAEMEHYKRLFDVNFTNTPEEHIKSSGYVVHSLEAAIWCLLTTDSYSDCVLKAVNLGSDTDTVAAIAGALAGCLYGIEGIPEKWISTLLQREMIDNICLRFADSLFQKQSNYCTHYLIDTHGHYVYGIDDGATDIETSLQMIRAAREQGVRAIFCTSHSWGQFEKYKLHFEELQKRVVLEKLDVRLYPGTEIECCDWTLSKTFNMLKAGIMHSLGKSKYIMLEFETDISAKEVLSYVKQLTESTEYIPVIAHVERYPALNEDPMALKVLQSWNIPLQINAYSLVEEKNHDVRDFARKLLDHKLVTFIGSDAHRLEHRPPNVKSGIEYIYKSCDKEYADNICFRNAQHYLLVAIQ